MKKVLWGIGGVIALLAAAVLVIPSVIDWNAYKPEIAEQVRKLTGRELVIAGDIDLNILPSPALVAEKVSLSSIDGAQSPDFVILNSVQVHIALAPLLAGKLRIESVRLVEPQIFLEVLADGRTTWVMSPPNAPADPAQGNQSSASAPINAGDAGPDIGVDNFELVGGTVIYQDAASGTKERIEDINLNVGAASLSSGPIRADGNLMVRGLRLGIDLNIGDIVKGRTFPLNLGVKIGGDSAEIKLAGTILGIGETPRFRGDLSVVSANIGRVVSALANGADLPAPLSQALAISGALDASANGLALDNLLLDFGGAKGTGKVSGTFNGSPKIAVELNVDKVAADPWLTVATPAKPQSGSAPAAPAQTAAATQPAAPAVDEDFALPTGIAATVAVKVGEISLRGDSVRNVVINADLANGEVTLSQLSLQGPGGSEAAVFGFLTAKNGKPTFDGSLEAKVRDPHALMKWANVDTSALKPGKPGALALSATVIAQPESISVNKLGLSFDETKIAAAATIALRDRLGIGASVTVDKLDLDAYLADAPATPPASKPTKPATTGDGTTASSPPSDTTSVFDALKPLADFDANVRANVGLLKTAGMPIRDIAADVSLIGGALKIKSLTVGDAASVSLSVNGGLKGLGSVPEAQDLSVRATVGDPAKVAALAGVELPVPAKNLGKVSLNAALNGLLTAPSISSTLNAFAATVNADGKLNPFDLANMFDLKVGVRHDDAASLFQRLDTGYKPAGDIGALNVASKITGGISGFSFTDLVAALGAAKVNGAGTVVLAGERPKLTTTLTTGNIVVDPFLPAATSAALSPDESTARVIPARFWVPEGGRLDFKQLIASVAERWSPVPFDFSTLQALDADITVTSPRISYHEYNLDGAKLLSTLNTGVLKVNEFSGAVFGGSVMSTAAVDASAKRPTLAGLVTLGNMDIGAASKAAGIAGTTGMLTSRIEVSTLGSSVRDWIGSLDGKGAIEIKGIKGKSSLADLPVIGLALGPLMQIFEVLNSGLGSLLGAGAKTGIGETDVTSTFTIANGVVNTKDTKIISNVYQGNLAGDINLPLWSMNVGGKVAVDQGLVGTLLANVARLPSQIPFQVTGNIDSPNVKIQSFSGAGSEGGGGIKVPGLDKLEKKAPGIGGLLNNLLGGGTAAPAEPVTPPAQSGSTESAPPPQPEQKKPDATQQLLKKLFK